MYFTRLQLGFTMDVNSSKRNKWRIDVFTGEEGKEAT